MLIEEIKILSDDTLQPVFRIPLAMDSKEPAPSEPALSQMILLNPRFGS